MYSNDDVYEYQDTWSSVCVLYVIFHVFTGFTLVCLQQWTDALRSLIHNTRANNVCQMTCLRKQWVSSVCVWLTHNTFMFTV